MKQFTDITVLLDRSGSMSSIKEPMETAFNRFIEEQRAVPTTKLTLIQFDDINDQEMVYGNVPITFVEKLKLDPRGNTPLIDALCQVIDNTGKRYSRLLESERPDQVVLVVITDGQENASRIYKRKDVFDRITRQKNQYNWQIIYLGANQDSFAESQSYGINWGSTLKWTPDAEHIRAMMQANSQAVLDYAQNTGALRGTGGIAFANEVRTTAATKEDLAKDSNTNSADSK